MRWAVFGFTLLALVFSLSGCFLKRIDRGAPTADGYWSWKYRVTHGRRPSDQEKAEYRKLVKAEVEEYLARHPERTKTVGLPSLMVWRGMTKAEVLLLLKDSGKVIRDSQELARLAGKFWPELQGRADEAWSYYDYDESILFFQGDTLIDILSTFTDVL